MKKYSFIVIIVILLFFTSCDPVTGSISVAKGGYYQAEDEVRTYEESIIVLENQITVTIESGTFNSTSDISVAVSENQELPFELPSEYSLKSPVYNLESSQTEFEKPVMVELTYDDSSNPDRLIGLHINGDFYEPISGTVNKLENTITFELYHFCGVVAAEDNSSTAPYPEIALNTLIDFETEMDCLYTYDKNGWLFQYDKWGIIDDPTGENNTKVAYCSAIHNTGTSNPNNLYKKGMKSAIEFYYENTTPYVNDFYIDFDLYLNTSDPSANLFKKDRFRLQVRREKFSRWSTIEEIGSRQILYGGLTNSDGWIHMKYDLSDISTDLGTGEIWGNEEYPQIYFRLLFTSDDDDLPENQDKFYGAYVDNLTITTDRDNTPGAPVISADALSNDSTPTFSWTSSEDEFQCRIDDGDWYETTRKSFTPYQALEDGNHIFFVQVLNDGGYWSVEAEHEIRIDTQPPTPPVLTAPSETNDTTPKWDWQDDSDADHFIYILDSGSEKTTGYSSYTPYSGLTDGIHTLQVATVDRAGNVSDFSSRTVTISTETPPAPTVSITRESGSDLSEKVEFITIIDEGETVSFEMGQGVDYFPSHPVELTVPYAISQYEITNTQFIEVFNYGLENGKITQNGSMFVTNSINPDNLFSIDPLYSDIRYDGNLLSIVSDKENHPARGVTWYGGIYFCNLLSAMENLEPCYDTSTFECSFESSGYRLPTEAEWEYAARGGIDGFYPETPDYLPYRFSGSFSLYPIAQFNSTYSLPVGFLYPNEFYLYDMTGNVSEWCNDWYNDLYDTIEEYQKDPRGVISGTQKATRGGGYIDESPIILSVSYSRVEDPSNPNTFEMTGIRLVISPVESIEIPESNNPTPTWVWNKPDGVEGFNIKIDSNSWEYTSETSFCPTDELDDGEHTFYIQSVDSLGNSSLTISSDIVIDTQPPNKPSNSSISESSINEINLNWDTVSDANKYNIYRSDSLDGNFVFIGSTSTNSYIDNSCEFGRNQYYKISSVDIAGESELSSAIKCVTVSYHNNECTDGIIPVEPFFLGNSKYIVIQNNTGNLFREGFNFAGWCTSADGIGQILNPGEILYLSDSITLYAKWEPLYSITYDGNGNTDGTVPIDDSLFRKHEPALVLGNVNTLSKVGSYFSEWNTRADGEGISYREGDSIALSESIVLFAQWKKSNYIIYNGNGHTSGNVPISPYYQPDETVDVGEFDFIYIDNEDMEVLANENNLFRTNYYFTKWNTEPDGSGYNFFPGDKIRIEKYNSEYYYYFDGEFHYDVEYEDANVILYAIWELEVTDVFIGRGDIYYLKADDSLWITSDNAVDHHQIGYSNEIPIQQLYLENVTNVYTPPFCGSSMGLSDIFALFKTTENELYAYGVDNNNYTDLNISSYIYSPTIVDLDFEDIAIGYEFGIHLLSNREIYGFGDNRTDGQIGFRQYDWGVAIPSENNLFIDDNVIKVQTGKNHSIYLKSDKSLWALGNNDFGQLCNDEIEPVGFAISIFDEVTDFDCGENYTAILDSFGDLYIAGRLELTTSTYLDFSVLTKIDSNVDKIFAGLNTLYYIKNEDSLYGLGSNSRGQLGIGNTESQTEPIFIIDNVIKVSHGYDTMYIHKTDNSLWGTGSNYNFPFTYGDTYEGYPNLFSTYWPSFILIDSSITEEEHGMYY